MNKSITFASWIDYLGQLDTITQNQEKKINRTDYEQFCKEFTFNKLKDEEFGTSFCKRFGFNDIFLKRLSDKVAKDHIEKLGYIK